MRHRLSWGLASLMLVGWLGIGCGSQESSPPVEPPPPANQPPVLSGNPGASSSGATDSGHVQLSVSVTDPDNDPLTFSWTQEPASPAGSFSSDSIANPVWTAPSVMENTPFTLRVTVSDGKGGSVSGSVMAVALSSNPEASEPANSVTVQGCTFSADAVQTDQLPPVYDYIVTRHASSTCPYGDAIINLGTTYLPGVSIVSNALGIAVAYTVKNTPSGSSPLSVGIQQLAPDTLSRVRSAGLSCGPTYYSVDFSKLSILDGTTLQVDGTKGCVIHSYGASETGSGSHFHAYFPDFFTTTTPPTIVAY